MYVSFFDSLIFPLRRPHTRDTMRHTFPGFFIPGEAHFTAGNRKSVKPPARTQDKAGYPITGEERWNLQLY